MKNDNALKGEGENVSFWQRDVDRNMELLRERMDALEEVNLLAPGIPRTSALVKPFVIQIENNNICYSLFHIITSRKFAALQFLWLLVCLFSFLYYASIQFHVALRNESDDNKPEKLLYVEDLGAEDSKHTMPYIYIIFTALIRDNDWDYNVVNYHSPEEIANVLAVLKNLQNFNETAQMKYWSQNGTNRVTGVFEEIEVGYKVAYDYCIRGYFRLKLLPPIPGSEWTFDIPMSYEWRIWNYMLEIWDCWISIDYKTSGFSSNYPDAVWINYNPKWLIWAIGYKERVTHTLENKKIRTIESELLMYYEMPWEDGFSVELLPDLKIEHWEEYVEYGYWDWIGAMGGIFSLLYVVYFVVGKYIAVYSGSEDLGILPAMSDVFRNQEDIGIMKRKLQGRYPVRVLDTNSTESAL